MQRRNDIGYNREVHSYTWIAYIKKSKIGLNSHYCTLIMYKTKEYSMMYRNNRVLCKYQKVYFLACMQASMTV